MSAGRGKIQKISSKTNARVSEQWENLQKTNSRSVERYLWNAVIDDSNSVMTLELRIADALRFYDPTKRATVDKSQIAIALLNRIDDLRTPRMRQQISDLKSPERVMGDGRTILIS